MNVLTASPPMKVWMPNQPQATMARRMEGMWAPWCPKAGARQHGEGDAVLGAGVAR
jgi:hypothetical protein